MTARALASYAASTLGRAVHHPVLRAAAGFTAITTVVKALAFLKEAVVASAFGVGLSMDSYLMALVVIGFPSGVLLNAAQTVFIREYVRVVEVEGEAAADRFMRGALLGLLIALTVLLVLWLPLLPSILSIVGHGLARGQQALVATNVHRLIPYYYLNGVNLLGYGALQARRAFARSALVPIVTPLVIILLVAAVAGDLRFLIGALTLGTCCETAILYFLLKRSHRGAEHHAVPRVPRLREFTWGTLVLIPGTLISGLSPVIEQTIASGLGPGAISALGFAAKLPATLNSLLTGAVGVTLLPYFSQRLSRGYDEHCRRFFVRSAALMAFAGFVIAGAAVIGSGPFVRIAFQRGEFSAGNALVVSALQQAYLWQLPGQLAATVAIRFIAAQGRFRVLTIGNVLMVPITGLLQWSLSSVWGAQGLAFGTAAGVALTALALFGLALRHPTDSSETAASHKLP
jgi:putative peptidoglycan lipid II flippase